VRGFVVPKEDPVARVPTYLENGTTPVSVYMKAPLAEARRLAAAD